MTLFDTKTNVYIQDGAYMDYAEECIRHLNNLDFRLREHIREKLFKYYEFVRENYDDIEFVPFEEIMEYIKPLNVSIEPPEAEVIAYSIECGCNWEIDMGIEIIIKDNELLYVGEFFGIGPWADDEVYECDY